MEIIGDLLKNPWFLAMLVGVVISIVGYQMYPQQQQNLNPIYNDYTSSDVIDVIIPESNKSKALEVLKDEYPDYDIIEEYYSEAELSWIFRLKKKEE